MKKLLKIRKAFSMVELIFVIVVLGIISTYYADIITQVYKNYILQKATHNASIKTTLAADQIANRLRYAIPGSVYRRTAKSGGTIEALDDPMTAPADSYTVLEWVGYDGDSFESFESGTNRKPGWSGLCDVDISSQTTIKTPGSNLDFAQTVISNLGGNIDQAHIYFPGDIDPTTGRFISHKVSGATGDTITLDGNVSRIVEHYKLAWTSYALVVENGDLFLYYNFDPTPGATVDGSKSLLMKNINTFKFKGDGQTIRFKICKSESIGEDFNITSCKEKAVF
jgi:prepilin-type N-terminal cleavage/methylation domain-containing protein